MKIHIAQKGETLWKIAKKYGVNFEELKKMNAQLSNPDMIMPGMKIKVPGGAAVKEHHVPPNIPPNIPHHVPKEMPKVENIQKKEVPVPIVQPKKEIPVPIVQPTKEIIKEVPKEKPYPIYQPVMPQPLPEIDISNYYMMNMQQMQTQVQEMPKEEIPVQMPVMPVQQPVMPVQQPVYNYCYPVMPVCDPCYNPYIYGYQPQMMPQVQGAMVQPMAVQPAAMPGVPTTGYIAGVPHWHDESSSHPGMYGKMDSSDHYGHAPGAVMPAAQPAVPYPSYQMPYSQVPVTGGYPVMPGVAPAYTSAGVPGDCGCGGGGTPYYASYPYMRQAIAPPMQPFGSVMPSDQANAYAMPVRHDEGNADE
ncbi:SafA/ExsA family spore coat assembly protein [Bacillus sp. FJAT-49732]|uniref:SafA/ExsA family spore coat assembly protein n=1 Tax=Lederbergia citrisecunda TaxID=2833583 RepID=A0A942TN73_9BACI|nr:SafA/ExsA family spore coat assembly protein [Lederbergia citrisecunda]